MSQDERLGSSSDMNRISRVHWTMPFLMGWIPGPEISSARISNDRGYCCYYYYLYRSSKNISSHSLEDCLMAEQIFRISEAC
ncbi:hypothetical protein CEXT_722751 [Caerostris extrusa]|uniref:Uncharacterized protein n=1 Tax=Caerostris extrusa TaxID=172846 RepID=A0AAV4QV65_CAEEX|nr:hypothetical protein CEXT_722751 [Caerostris extrusa]